MMRKQIPKLRRGTAPTTVLPMRRNGGGPIPYRLRLRTRMNRRRYCEQSKGRAAVAGSVQQRGPPCPSGAAVVPPSTHPPSTLSTWIEHNVEPKRKRVKLEKDDAAANSRAVSCGGPGGPSPYFILDPRHSSSASNGGSAAGRRHSTRRSRGIAGSGVGVGRNHHPSNHALLWNLFSDIRQRNLVRAEEENRNSNAATPTRNAGSWPLSSSVDAICCVPTVSTSPRATC